MNETTETLKNGTIGDKLPENKIQNMPEKKYSPLEETVDKYSTELPTDMQSFYKTLSHPYNTIFTQTYTAYKTAGVPNPEKEAVKVIGAMIGAELIDFAEKKGHNYEHTARQAVTEIMQNLGYTRPEIENYFPTNKSRGK